MTYRRPFFLTILCWLHTLLLFWCVYPFLAGLLSFPDDGYLRVTLSGLLLLLPIISGWLLLPVCRHFVLYFLIGCVISGLTGWMASVVGGPYEAQKIIAALLTTVISLFIFIMHTRAKVQYGRMKEEYVSLHEGQEDFPLQEREVTSFLKNPQFGHLGWCAVLYLLSILMDNRDCLPTIFVMVLADVLVLVAYRYGDGFYEYVKNKWDTSNLPLKTMRRIHRFSGIVGALILLLFLMPSILYGREVTFRPGGDQPIIEMEEDNSYSGEDVSLQIDSPEWTGNVNERTSSNPPAWVQTLLRVLCTLILAEVVIAVIMAAVVGLRNMRRNFAVEEDDESVFLEEEKDGLVKRIFYRPRREGRMTPNQQIRRRYRRMIRRAMKRTPASSGTPTEIEREVALSEDAQMQRLHPYYEKARYSREGCTPEDVRSAVPETGQ